MSNKKLAALFVCLSAAMWGFDGVVLTPRLYNLDVGFVVFMLHLIPFILMNILLYREYHHLKTFTGSDFFYFFLIALFGGSIGTLAIVKALFIVNFKHLTVVALLQKLQPVIAVLLASVLLKERINRNFFLWALLAITGGYFLTFQFTLPEMTGDDNMFKAALWSLLAAFSFGSATVFGKKVLHKVSFKTALFYRYGFTSVLMFFFVLFTQKFDQFTIATGSNWIFFIVISLTTGSGAIMLYYYGLKRINAKISTICELCFPISTILFDYLFNHQVLSFVQCISAAVMLIAIYQITANQEMVNQTHVNSEKLCNA
jgi:drug/metabolite transporter (DMT)-like permease